MSNTGLNKSPLGQATVYVNTYAPDLLFPVPRAFARDKIGLTDVLPFHGMDIWNGYEISWLNLLGKPEVAAAVFSFPCTTPYIVESKSFKLYLNSFTQSKFASLAAVKQTMEKDLSTAVAGPVTVDLFYLLAAKPAVTADFPGTCVDMLDIAMDTYQVNPQFLHSSAAQVEESLYTNLLKSNCLATGQADWGSLQIRYAGNQIDHAGFLKYIVSFRNHSGFAEHCVEQIYIDIMNRCEPKQLTVYARYTRRGGLDINPFRSNFEKNPVNIRQFRQ